MVTKLTVDEYKERLENFVKSLGPSRAKNPNDKVSCRIKRERLFQKLLKQEGFVIEEDKGEFGE